MTTASWYHCSVKPVSRSAGRSVVAAAAYRLGECLHDELYAKTHDYTRRRGVEATFTIVPADAPQWAHTGASPQGIASSPPSFGTNFVLALEQSTGGSSTFYGGSFMQLTLRTSN
jgi:MobA/MobL family